MKEVKAWHCLEHPNVARLHGIVQLPNTIAMVSSWCENGTIVKYLRETNPGANRLRLVSKILRSVTFSVAVMEFRTDEISHFFPRPVFDLHSYTR